MSQAASGKVASYTTLTVYRDNNRQLPPTVEMLVADGVLDHKLTSAVTTPDGYPIYRCPTNWRLAVGSNEPTAAPADLGAQPARARAADSARPGRLGSVDVQHP